MYRATLLILASLALSSCASYSSFIAEMNNRKINSCVEANITTISIPLQGSAHIYTATGGANVMDCISVLR